MRFTASKTAVLRWMVACEWPSKSVVRLPLKTCLHTPNALLGTATRCAKAVGQHAAGEHFVSEIKAITGKLCAWPV